MKGIKQFFKRLLGIEITMSEQEQLIYNIFIKLLDHPETNKVLYNGICSYLSNTKMDMETSIEGNEIILKCGQEMMSIMCTSKFMMYLSNTVNHSVERSVESFHNKMIDNRKSSLKNIEYKIDSK